MSADQVELKPNTEYYSESDLLPLSRLADMEYCERRAALHLVEQVWEENVHTALGTAQHGVVHETTGTESRGDLRITRGLMIHSFRLGLIGKADVVEFRQRLEDNDPFPTIIGQSSVSKYLRTINCNPLTGKIEYVCLPDVAGWWSVMPVEYKPGRLKQQRSFQVQLCAQALCLEEMLGVAINSGAIFYGRPRRRLEVSISDDLRKDTEVLAQRLHELYDAGVTPPAVYGKKCKSCSLLETCQPKATGSRTAAGRYVDTMLRQIREPEPDGEMSP